MKYELKQGDVIELENGEHWLYGENASYRLDKDVNPKYWHDVKFDDNMKAKDTHEQIVKIWSYDNFYCEFLEIVDKLKYIEPSWVYEDGFKVGDIVRITFYDGDVDTYIVDKCGYLVNKDGEYFSLDKKFPTYDRIKNSSVVTKVELMKLETVKEL
jgi:hypothetical protein